MGRTLDTPEQQAAKGFPRGKRGSKAQRDREARMRRVTELLAPVTDAGEVACPAFLKEAGFDAAHAVWRRLAPELKRTHRLPVDSHEAFAVYCCTYAEWLETQIDIQELGRTQRVKTVAGGMMERDRPAMRHRQSAFDNLLKLSERFGLTPRDMYALFKDQAGAAHGNPGLFDWPQGKIEEAKEETAAEGGVVGSAKRNRSQPPVH